MTSSEPSIVETRRHQIFPTLSPAEVIARFEDYTGNYPYHCHILSHEDNEMMRQFRVPEPVTRMLAPGLALLVALARRRAPRSHAPNELRSA